MGSTALAAAVALRGYGVPNFPQEINKVLKKQRDIYLLSYEALTYNDHYSTTIFI